MEFAAGGELFERIVNAGRFSEDEARYFFQQLISGVDYCHTSGVCHRDLKLENTLLDGNPAPRLKICDFGYSKSAFDSQPKSTVGTPAYIAPEVLQRKEYNGQPADVWSCGVTLYVMLVGAYPFEDPQDPRNFRKTIQRIMNVKFSFPPNLAISPECQDLIRSIFVANPQQRISIAQIRQHPWFLKNLPAELANPDTFARAPEPHQSLDDIRELIRAARALGDSGPKAGALPLEFNEDDYMDADISGGAGPGGPGMGLGPIAAAAAGSGNSLGSGPGSGPPSGYLMENGYPPQPHPHAHAAMHHPGLAVGHPHVGVPMGMALPPGMAVPVGVGGMPGMAHPHAHLAMTPEYQAAAAAAAGGYLAMPARGYPHSAAAVAAAHQAAVQQVAAAQHAAAGYAAAQQAAAVQQAAAAARRAGGPAYGSPQQQQQQQQQAAAQQGQGQGQQ
ncbi:hypothetical protein HYH03_018483 [Edaphochlamys debaryana]|uniref:non-specific serine/threonine protein kinase n=1 Tax=Edaphochlamys debaryana TaxID=47281 RepID=A0A835XLW0_9CHLO|nr:hypothetical protein HYH03_018483 [Edaphochlamys debaryana]|eukprot:KAG2482599.1 hypothetical protein HYH03_018483 [Edaphochlamys debaryana]